MRTVSDGNTNTSGQGPKVLRVGVIQGVRVVEERILPRKGAISFGTGEGNTFALAASDLPRSVTVFEPKGDSYELVFDDSMQGRIEGPDGKKEFATLKASTAKQGNVYRVPLDETSKGRIRLTPEITVLFHFVTPPPVVAVPQVPPELSQSVLKSVEPIFTAVLTASFLVHFAAGVYVNVTEPPAPPSVEDLKQLVERIQPPKVETKIPPPKTPANDAGKKDKEGPGKDPEATGGKKEPSGGGDAGDGGKKDHGGPAKPAGGGGGAGARDAIRQGIAGKGILQLIGGRGGGGGGGAAGSVFGAGGSVSDDIGSALAGTAGVGIAGGAGGGDGITRRGSGGGGGGDGSGGIGGAAAGIGEITTGGGGTVDTGTKQAAKISATFRTEEIEADGKIDKKSVASTIRRRQDGFQGCYETALKANSKLSGKLVVDFTIGDDGRVTEARVVKDGVGSAEVSSCVISLLKRLKFPAPSDGEVTISNTFVFQPGG